MGICVSHEPNRIEMPNRAKNCSLLYRPMDTSPYVNLHRSSTISGKQPHYHSPHLLSPVDNLDATTKDMLKLDFIDEHVWRNPNPYCALFHKESQAKQVTEEMINYELNSLKVQMAKSQAIIEALTNSPVTEDLCWSPSKTNYQTNFQTNQNTLKSPNKNLMVPNERPMIHVNDTSKTVLSDQSESCLPYFSIPQSQTQSFDQNPDQGHQRGEETNHSRSCPNILLTFQSASVKKLSTKDVHIKFDDIDSSRKRSCSYLAAIKHGNFPTEADPSTEHGNSIDDSNHSSRKLSTLPEDDLENVGKDLSIALQPSVSPPGSMKNGVEPPPYRSPPICTATEEIGAITMNELETKDLNSESSTVMHSEPVLSANQAKQKSQVSASDIAFQRRAGFSFRRRPDRTGAPPVVVNQAPPTIRRSSAIELVDDTSPVKNNQTTTFGKQKSSQCASTHGPQQLSVEMETSETESAKGSIESDYDIQLPAVTSGFSCIPTSALATEIETSENDELSDKLTRLNLNCPDLSLEGLSEEDIENHFQQLYLAFNNSKVTVKKRLEAQQRQRDLAETNVAKEVEQLKMMIKSAMAVSSPESSLHYKKQMVSNLQQQLDVLHQVVQRLSARAEIYGATEQEEKMCKAAQIMMQYVCDTKKKETKVQKELEETKKIMDRTAALGLGSYAKAIPNLGRRRASMCVPGAAASAPHLPLACTCRQSMEEGDQLLKTKLRCPLHCGNIKRRSISVFTAPSISIIDEFTRNSNPSSTQSSIDNEATVIEDQDNECRKNTQQNEGVNEKTMTSAVSVCEPEQATSEIISEYEDQDNSESCLEDDFFPNFDDLPYDVNLSDDGSSFLSDQTKSLPRNDVSSWIELIALLKSMKTRKKSDSFHEVLLWWKKSTDTAQLVRYAISGFLVTLAIAILVLSFIQPKHAND